jgi:perosamine synthetase
MSVKASAPNQATNPSPSPLAVFGGPKAIQSDPRNLFTWPIITPEDEAAVLEVLRRGGMSGTDVTMQFEQEFAAWQGSRYALGFSSGTAAIHAALFGCKVGVGDEVICPSVTYWASAMPAFSLGATVVFAEIDPQTLCIDPSDIERHISPRTRAILVVHYMGHPADMDPIMEIARRHNIKVIEDVSHAQGGLYKGRKLGTIGDVGPMSLMSGKSFAVGEAGILVTDDRDIYERAVAFGHYERYGNQIENKALAPFRGLPLGGHKYRMHQLSSAVGRVQLKYYDERCAEIRKAMNHFWDLLEGVPGLRPHRTPKDSDSNMAGWYAPHGLYRPEELGELSVTRFAQAVSAEGCECSPGVNAPLHLHPALNNADIYGDGRPTRIAHATRDVRQPEGSLPFSERVGALTYSIPWFKHDYTDLIEEYANAFRKVALHYESLLADDPGDPPHVGGWSFFIH